MSKTEHAIHSFEKEVREHLLSEQLRANEMLAPYTTFRIGGPADLVYDATSADDLANVILLARKVEVPYFVLGLGANILVGDLGFRGVVIRNCARTFNLAGDGTLRAESGAVMRDLIFATVRAGWSGLEHYIGIPSTVGGAVWQNLHFLAPAPERERTMFIAEVVETCELLTQEGERRVVDRAYMRFGYDTSVLHERLDVALAVTLRLTRGDSGTMHRILQENLAWRGSRHPWLEFHPSAGSIFKKIEGVGAGRLIDQCGLKGFRVGDAQISFIHANIVVNLGDATAADVRAVISHAQHAVRERFSQELTPEIGFVGEF
ncbi:MAG: UDP-N-acetylmuramate dehydrogenase [Gemmatimonadaceae bacterium]